MVRFAVIGTNFITDAFGVYRPNTSSCRPQVTAWLKKLGFDT